MRKRRFRYYCICLVFLLTATSFLSACSKKDADTGTKSTTTTPTPKAGSETNGTDEGTPAQDEFVKPTETVVIRWGTHYEIGLNPNYVDEVTGQYVMAEAERQAALAALAALKEELNVEIEFIQYSQDTRNELMTSVLAGNPVCDLAVIWGGAEGTVLAQNVLQKLDDYAYLYDNESYSWMFLDKLYGHNYLLSSNQTFHQKWPLVYNISMLEKVDAIKDENGKTIYPTDLFLAGEWTWATFTDYLTKIQAYYSNVAAPVSAVHDVVQAYETDHRYAGLSAMYSAGGAIYGEDGLAVNSPGSILGTKYIKSLMDKGLMVDPGTYDNGYTPQWTTAASDFSAGATVFTDCPVWWINGCATAATERGESIGMVPWPREDSLSLDDENYKQVNTYGDSVGVLKGVSEEKTELALRAFQLYYETYYKVYGGVDDISEYKSTMALSQAAAMGLDIYSEEYADGIIECFMYITDHLSPDYADLLDMRVAWDEIFGQGLYGVNAMPSYNVGIESNMSKFTNIIANMESILASSEVKDNQGPSLDGNSAVIAKGNGYVDYNWSEFFTATDAVDGALDMSTGTYEIVSEDYDFDTPGVYSGVVKCTISDLSGNKTDKKIDLIIYDGDNKTPPMVTAAVELPVISLNTDTSGIDWKTYISSAVDADGIDVSKNISADLSDIDPTAAGNYDVELTVTDYAGNLSSIIISVTVE